MDEPQPRHNSAFVFLYGCNFSTILRDDRAAAIKMETLSPPHGKALKAFASGSKAAANLIKAYCRRVAMG